MRDNNRQRERKNQGERVRVTDIHERDEEGMGRELDICFTHDQIFYFKSIFLSGFLQLILAEDDLFSAQAPAVAVVEVRAVAAGDFRLGRW